MSILILGDTHIPDRASKIPLKLEYLIEKGRPWDNVIFTGDLTEEPILYWVKSLGSKAFVVRGNMDHLPLPRSLSISIEGLNIGVHHGDGVYPRGDSNGLAMIAKQLDVDILVSGHTHSPFVKTGGGEAILLINPGSLTGVWGGGGGSMKPSFVILSKSSGTIKIKLYELERGEVVSKRITAWRNNGKWVLRVE